MLLVFVKKKTLNFHRVLVVVRQGITLKFHVVYVSRIKKCAIPSIPHVLHYVC